MFTDEFEYIWGGGGCRGEDVGKGCGQKIDLSICRGGKEFAGYRKGWTCWSHLSVAGGGGGGRQKTPPPKTQ